MTMYPAVAKLLCYIYTCGYFILFGGQDEGPGKACMKKGF